MSDEDSDDSDVSMDQDTSDGEESLINESSSDSSDDGIPVNKDSKASASTAAGIFLFFIIFLYKFL